MPFFSRIGLILAAYFVLGYPGYAHAQDANSAALSDGKPEIVVVMRRNQQVHTNLINSLLNAQVETPPYELSILTAAEFRDQILRPDVDFSPDLIVSLGTDLTEYIVALELQIPLLSTAIPRLSFEQLQQRHRRSEDADSAPELTAIYLDQPFNRSLNLIQAILPDTEHVGISLGPDTKHYETEIREELGRRNLKLSMGQVGSESQLINTLDQVLDESDVLLGIVDPLVFSRTSARNVLLTAYRWRVPLIGVSPAYVRAGALASVHSTPAQLGKQLADMIAQITEQGFETLPLPQHPKEFSVSVNYQVAEAMGIQLPEEPLLLAELMAMDISTDEEYINE